MSCWSDKYTSFGNDFHIEFLNSVEFPLEPGQSMTMTVSDFSAVAGPLKFQFPKVRTPTRSNEDIFAAFMTSFAYTPWRVWRKNPDAKAAIPAPLRDQSKFDKYEYRFSPSEVSAAKSTITITRKESAVLDDSKSTMNLQLGSRTHEEVNINSFAKDIEDFLKGVNIASNKLKKRGKFTNEEYKDTYVHNVVFYSHFLAVLAAEACRRMGILLLDSSSSLRQRLNGPALLPTVWSMQSGKTLLMSAFPYALKIVLDRVCTGKEAPPIYYAIATGLNGVEERIQTDKRVKNFRKAAMTYNHDFDFEVLWHGETLSTSTINSVPKLHGIFETNEYRKNPESITLLMHDECDYASTATGKGTQNEKQPGMYKFYKQANERFNCTLPVTATPEVFEYNIESTPANQVPFYGPRPDGYIGLDTYLAHGLLREVSDLYKPNKSGTDVGKPCPAKHAKAINEVAKEGPGFIQVRPTNYDQSFLKKLCSKMNEESSELKTVICRNREYLDDIIKSGKRQCVIVEFTQTKKWVEDYLRDKNEDGTCDKIYTRDPGNLTIVVIVKQMIKLGTSIAKDHVLAYFTPPSINSDVARIQDAGRMCGYGFEPRALIYGSLERLKQFCKIQESRWNLYRASSEEIVKEIASHPSLSSTPSTNTCLKNVPLFGDYVVIDTKGLSRPQIRNIAYSAFRKKYPSDKRLAKRNGTTLPVHLVGFDNQNKKHTEGRSNSEAVWEHMSSVRRANLSYGQSGANTPGVVYPLNTVQSYKKAPSSPFTAARESALLHDNYVILIHNESDDVAVGVFLDTVAMSQYQKNKILKSQKKSNTDLRRTSRPTYEATKTAEQSYEGFDLRSALFGEDS